MEVLKEYDAKTISTKVKSFVDSFYLASSTVQESDIDIVDFEDHSSEILNYYKLNVAKKIFAKTLLLEEVLDSKSTSYINIDKDLATYFNNNVKSNYDVSAITIRFVNLNEANATLRRFNLKAYRSQLYVLQDPRVSVVTGRAATALSDLGISNTGSISEADYRKYYDKYSINPDAGSDSDVALTQDETLVKFLEIGRAHV